MFAAVQRSIAKCFDGDPAVAKLTHVARLPGFNHCKGEPFRTRIIADNDLPRYTAAEILKEFPPEAKAHKPSGSLKGGRVVPADEPLRCAYSFLESEFMTADGVLTLQFYRGSYYRWQGTHFAEVDEKDVRAALYAFLDEAITPRAGGFEPFKPTKAKVNAILDALQSGVLQSRDKVVPFWLEPVQSRSVDGLIACGNGLLDLHSRTLRAHSPYLFNINCLPFDYDPAAAEPERWLQFLDDLWPDDEEARRTLQEIFGLLLTPETKHHKIFMLVGPKRSGKGTIARVLTGLLGKDNVVSPTLAGLSSHFGLAPLIDKRAAIISDARLGPQTNAHTVAERLLAISGDDPLTIDRKYRDAWTGHVGVRFLIQRAPAPNGRFGRSRVSLRPSDDAALVLRQREP
jgi:putative DNA primase/helicase